MRIGEIADLTGLSISNIRFYEKKGLIGPDRESNGKYRNYTEDDLICIKKIILYRKMDFSIETIEKILNEEIVIGKALEQQLVALKKKEQMIQGSINLCEKMITDCEYKNIDIEYYTNYVKEEETRGTIFAIVDDVVADFVDFTNIDSVGWNLFPYMYANRFIKYICCAFIFLAPIVAIVDDLLDGNGISKIMIFFWGGWIAIVFYNVVRFLRHRKDKGN